VEKVRFRLYKTCIKYLHISLLLIGRVNMFRKISIILISLLLLSGCTLFAATAPATLPQPTEDISSVDALGLAAVTPVCTAAVCPTCQALVTQSSPTAINTPVVKPTSTPIPIQTLIPSFTPISPGGKTATSPPPVARPFIVQPNSPVYLQNFTQTDKGCNWMGVAGQVFDKSGVTVKGLVVVVEGFIGPKPVEGIGMTGLAPKYGPGGFEVELGDMAVDTTTSLFITLYDTAGKMLSNPVQFNTFADCKKNLVLINFQQK
jgi:hypothetical protein